MRRLWLPAVLLIALGWAAYSGYLPGLQPRPKAPIDGTFETDAEFIKGAVERIELQPNGKLLGSLVEKGSVLSTANGTYTFDGQIGRAKRKGLELTLTLEGNDLRLSCNTGDLCIGGPWTKLYTRTR